MAHNSAPAKQIIRKVIRNTVWHVSETNEDNTIYVICDGAGVPLFLRRYRNNGNTIWEIDLEREQFVIIGLHGEWILATKDNFLAYVKVIDDPAFMWFLWHQEVFNGHYYGE